MKVIGEISTAILIALLVALIPTFYGKELGLCSGSDCLGMLLVGPFIGIAGGVLYVIMRVAYLLSVRLRK